MALSRRQSEYFLLEYHLNQRCSYQEYYVASGYQYHEYRQRVLLNTHRQFQRA